MNKAWISVSTFYSIMEQAVKNNGRAVLDARGGPPFEIIVDPEFAKEWVEEKEKILDKFNKIPN